MVVKLYLTCDDKRHVGDRVTVTVSANRWGNVKSKARKLGWFVNSKRVSCPVCCSVVKSPVLVVPKQVAPAIAGQPIRPFIRDPLPFVPLRVEPVCGVVWTRKAMVEEDDSFIPNQIGFSPTHEAPGTKAKIEVLRQRAARGNPLFHVDDRKGYGDG